MSSFVLAIGVALLAGCGRNEAPRGGPAQAARSRLSQNLMVRVLADTGRTLSLAAPLPEVNVTVARVSPARAGVPEPPLPPATPDTLLPQPAAQARRDAPRLLPPILRAPGTLIAPPSLTRATAVELDVRVDRLGRVVDVRWAEGDADSALVVAAQRCAETMQFYPALLGGEPVDVWCRQRFEFTPR